MEKPTEHDRRGLYRTFSIELAIDFVIMYVVMYTMIATLDHFYIHINNLYMTLMMVAPMALVMLMSMRSMFPDRRRNWLIGAGAALVFVAAFAGMRTQAAVDNSELIKAMIPHHSGAILMCEQASLTDPELIALCREIVQTQKAEIARMQAILARQ